MQLCLPLGTTKLYSIYSQLRSSSSLIPINQTLLINYFTFCPLYCLQFCDVSQLLMGIAVKGDVKMAEY